MITPRYFDDALQCREEEDSDEASGLESLEAPGQVMSHMEPRSSIPTNDVLPAMKAMVCVSGWHS